MQESELLKKAEGGRGRELGWPDSHGLWDSLGTGASGGLVCEFTHLQMRQFRRWQRVKWRKIPFDREEWLHLVGISMAATWFLFFSLYLNNGKREKEGVFLCAKSVLCSEDPSGRVPPARLLTWLCRGQGQRLAGEGSDHQARLCRGGQHRLHSTGRETRDEIDED